jgi:hypothetical protein
MEGRTQHRESVIVQVNAASNVQAVPGQRNDSARPSVCRAHTYIATSGRRSGGGFAAAGVFASSSANSDLLTTAFLHVHMTPAGSVAGW